MQAVTRQTVPLALPIGALLDAAFITDPSMGIGAWNRGAEALFGFTAAEAIDRDAIQLLAGTRSRSSTSALTAGLAQDGAWSGILLLRRRDRTNFLAHLTATVIHNSETTDTVLCVAHPVDTNERPRNGSPLPRGHARGIELHRETRVALVDGTPLDLTSTEADLLDLLLANPGRVLSVEEIATTTWGHGTHGSANFVQAAVSRLRRKLRAAGRGRLIETVRGRGYTARLR